MTHPGLNAEGWDGTSADYSLLERYTGLYADDVLKLARITASDRLLDVATGTGALAVAAARRGAHVLATDLSTGMIEQLRARIASEHIDQLYAEVMDGQSLRVSDGSFDVACSMFGLILFSDRKRGFAELRRVVRAGGRVVVVAWSAPERMPVVSPFFQALRSVAPELPLPSGPPPIFSLSNPEHFNAELEESGLRDVAVHEVTHEWVADSPGVIWDALSRATPPLRALVTTLGPERAERARRAYIESFGEGPTCIECGALVGLGIR